MILETKAYLEDDYWPVKVKVLGGGNYVIEGRATRLEVLLRDSHDFGGGDYLVAVSNYQRCGCLDARIFSGDDLQQYVGIDNIVDAYTLAAGLRAIYQHRDELGGWLG